ncbi:MAG: hypothetical protein ACRELC_12360 [Gemmatimonadota bacterium]
MSSLPSDLLEVARLNPVPRDAVAGARHTATAQELRDRIVSNAVVPHATRWGARRVLALVAVVVAVAAAGTAIASRLVTESDVERFLPQGSAVFVGTDPQCVAIDPGVAYRCRLARPPATVAVTGSDGRPAYKGAKFGTVDDESRVNGGCVAVNHPGTLWDCYLGERAVAEDILSPGVLGEKQAGPGHG